MPDVKEVEIARWGPFGMCLELAAELIAWM